MVALNKPSAGATDWTTSVNDNWTTLETELNAQGSICEGRLTLTSGTPVTTSDVTAAGTLYFAPFKGNRIALYDGTKWTVSTFTERSLSLTLTSGKNYDVFLYNNSGTLTLELSAAWTNDTTRADALTTQDGVYVKSGDTTRRYLGTIRASGTNTTEDSFSKRFVWNRYHQLVRPMKVVDTTDTWNYTTATWREKRGVSNRVEFVVGLAECPVTATVLGSAFNSGNTQAAVGIGLDATSVNSAQIHWGWVSNQTRLPLIAHAKLFPSIGYHYLAALEISTASGTTTWAGDDGNIYVQTGLLAEVWA